MTDNKFVFLAFCFLVLCLVFCLAFISDSQNKIEELKTKSTEFEKRNTSLKESNEVLKSHLNLRGIIIDDLKAQNENLWDYIISTDDYIWHLKMVESEGPDETKEGKIMIASTPINRVKYGSFGGNTIEDVIFARGQYDVVELGDIYKAKPSKETIEAVNYVISNGAVEDVVYFMIFSQSGKYSKEWMRTQEFLGKVGNTEFYAVGDR